MLDNTLYNALITAVVSAIVTNFFLWWQKRNDYKRDYYKKVVDKRIKAYEQVEALAACFDHQTTNLYTNQKWLACCITLEAAKTTFKMIEDVEKHGLWLSEECNQCITNINKTLMPLFYFDDKQEEAFKNERFKLSIDMYEDMVKHRENLRKIISNDMMNLHDVDNFFECNIHK